MYTVNWELNENLPIHLPNLVPKLDPCIYRRSVCKVYVKLAHNFGDLFENFAKIGYWRSIYLPKFRFDEKGSFIYQKCGNGTLFRGTSPIPLVTWKPPPPLRASRILVHPLSPSVMIIQFTQIHYLLRAIT